jgi:acetyl esterase/lipase
MICIWKKHTNRMAILATLLFLSLAWETSAAEIPTAEFPLWPAGTPGALGTRPKDIPTLTPFFAPAEKATGAAIVVCPGGGYGGLAAHEGADYAKWLNEHGVTAFVLKYRLGSAGYRHPIMLNDAARAVRVVRSNAADWKLDPQRIGIMGSSAGGHLTSTLLTHFDAGNAQATDAVDRESSRPSIGILCYPVITMGEKTHGGSKKNLLGDNPSAELVELLSNEKQVTKDTPPTFIFHTAEDSAVLVENALMFAESLAKNKVPFSLHIYPKGRHGIGLGGKPTPETMATLHPWTRELEIWLKERTFVK